MMEVDVAHVHVIEMIEDVMIAVETDVIVVVTVVVVAIAEVAVAVVAVAMVVATIIVVDQNHNPFLCATWIHLRRKLIYEECSLVMKVKFVMYIFQKNLVVLNLAVLLLSSTCTL